jgi:hypothetical protein
MAKIDKIDSRLNAIEQSGGYVTLPDGSRFRPGSGLALMRQALLFERDHGREPQLSDFPEDTAAMWKKWAQWHPPKTASCSAAEMVSDLARKICDD